MSHIEHAWLLLVCVRRRSMTIKGTVEDEQTQFWWVNSPGCRRKNMSRDVMTPTVPDIVSVFSVTASGEQRMFWKKSLTRVLLLQTRKCE